MAATQEFNPAIESFLEPILPHLRTHDQRIIDVMIQRPGEVWLQVAGKAGYQRVPNGRISFEWGMQLCKVLARTAGLRFDENHPLVMRTLPGGHRFTGLLGDRFSTHGLAISVRVRRHITVDLEKDYNLSHWGARTSRNNAPSAEELAMSAPDRLRRLIAGHGNILISGGTGTGTGKTTMMNSLGMVIPSETRVITVEDVQEILLPHLGNQVNLTVSRQSGDDEFGYRQIIDVITRLNPDSILVQELSVHNAAPAFRLLNTGHRGFMSTVHANTPLEALEAWRRNYELSEKRGGETVVRFLARNLDAIVQIDFAEDGIHRQAGVVFRGADGVLDLSWRDLLEAA